MYRKIDRRVESWNDMGVFIDEKLNFREHITKKVNIANRNLGIIFRSFTYMDNMDKSYSSTIPGFPRDELKWKKKTKRCSLTSSLAT